ncbi:MAG: hypothetical protein L0Y66_23265 [Myxococcaceae bacterium]|nr:hypothetical protein [Myxococcaceae bacterium]MCI0670248.1 hypothetical protein [Myxococcaceae bacterium]
MHSLLLALVLAAGPSAEPPQTVRLASPGLSGVNISSEEADFFNDYFSQQLSQQGEIHVTTKTEVAALLGFERQKQLLGCADASASCLVEVSGALGVDGLVLGSVGRFGDRYGINLKIVDASTGQALAGFSDQVGDEQTLLDFLASSARELAVQLKQARGMPVTLASNTERPVHAIRLSLLVASAGYERRVADNFWVGGRLGMPLGAVTGADFALGLDVTALGRWEPVTGPVGFSLFGGVSLGYMMGFTSAAQELGDFGGLSLLAGPELSLFRNLRVALEVRFPLGMGGGQFAAQAPVQLYPQVGWSFLF